MADTDDDSGKPLEYVGWGNLARGAIPDGCTGDILIVDDSATSLVLASRILARAGYATRTAPNGKEAQESILAKPPCLVLVDLYMPEMGGLELCDWIKHTPSLADIPVLFLSGATETARKAEAFGKGGADFITKPFQMEELLLRVALHLQLAMQQREIRRSFAEREAEVEAQLRRSNSELLKLHAAVEQSPSSVVIADLEGRIEYVNRKFTEMTGYSFAEVRGKTPVILRAPSMPVEIYREIRATLQTGQTWRGILHSRHKDGSLYWERAFVAPFRAQSDKAITHMIALAEDITAQREIEAQLQQAQKLEAIGQLAAGIAHEINTPAQFVSDNLHFLKGAFEDLLTLAQGFRRVIDGMGDSPEKQALERELHALEERADVDYVSSNAVGAFASSLDGIQRISTIVRAMKEFSHPDQREMEAADVNAAIVNTLTIARNEYKYVADVEREFGELPPVVCHVGDVCQVILNILVNAAHAIGEAFQRTGKRGLIRIRSISEPDFVRIEIEDTGPGIPAFARDHVFEPFFTTKEVGKGTGQGLAIAHNVVVKKHKGTLTFTTEMGKGTTFVIRLPIEQGESGKGKDDAATTSEEAAVQGES